MKVLSDVTESMRDGKKKLERQIDMLYVRGDCVILVTIPDLFPLVHIYFAFAFWDTL